MHERGTSRGTFMTLLDGPGSLCGPLWYCHAAIPHHNTARTVDSHSLYAASAVNSTQNKMNTRNSSVKTVGLQNAYTDPLCTCMLYCRACHVHRPSYTPLMAAFSCTFMTRMTDPLIHVVWMEKQYELTPKRKKTLFESLDRFANNVIRPLLVENVMKRELTAIDNEFNLSKTGEWSRVFQVMAKHAIPKHPMGQFGWGNSKTLKVIPSQKRINVHFHISQVTTWLWVSSQGVCPCKWDRNATWLCLIMIPVTWGWHMVVTHEQCMLWLSPNQHTERWVHFHDTFCPFGSQKRFDLVLYRFIEPQKSGVDRWAGHLKF